MSPQSPADLQPILDLIARGSDEILKREELAARLAASTNSGRPEVKWSMIAASTSRLLRT